MTKKNKIIIGVVAIVVVAVIAAVLYFVFGRSNQDAEVAKRIKNNPALVEIYAKIQKYQTQEQAADVLLAEGSNWKSLGELTRDPYFFQKALNIYDLGTQKFGEQNVLFYWNAGKVAESLNRFDLAENYYQESIKIAPSYPDSYQNLADLYQFKLKKSADDVIKVYDEGLKATMGNAPLFLNRCSYLRQVERNQDALACYKLLVEQYPTNQGYKDVVSKLEALLKK